MTIVPPTILDPALFIDTKLKKLFLLSSREVSQHARRLLVVLKQIKFEIPHPILASDDTTASYSLIQSR